MASQRQRRSSAHAANLTPDPIRQAQRALDAAQAKLDAGAPEAATALLTVARDACDDEFLSARIELLKAKLAFAVSRGNVVAGPSCRRLPKMAGTPRPAVAVT